uniref:Uncharacterized protein n=1 Tax=Anopheles melas TaxID=34690 RepID=A0A182TPR9_9DIPT
MFSCLWQLWDWIDPPTFTTMESKKLQQLQQANSHLAPMPQMKPPQQGGGGYQHGYDYGATGPAPGRSAMFPAQYQSYGQPHPSASSLRSPYSAGSPKSSLSTNSGALYGATDGADLSSASGAAQSGYHLHPAHHQQQTQQQQGLLHAQHQQYRSNTLGPGGNGGGSYGYDQQQQHQLYRVSSPSSGSGGERERLYQTAPLVRAAGGGGPGSSGVGTPHSGTLDSGAAGGAGGAYGEEGESLYLQRAGYQQHPGVANSPPGGAASEIIIQQNIPGQVVNQACQTQISSMVLAGSSNAAGQQQQQQQ